MLIQMLGRPGMEHIMPSTIANAMMSGSPPPPEIMQAMMRSGGMPSMMGMMNGGGSRGGGGGSGSGFGGPPPPPNGDYGEGLGPQGGLGGGPKRGKNAIDCLLYEPATGDVLSLSSLWKGSGQFLCISFGSSSCNMFRRSHSDFESLASRHRSNPKVLFLSVYISEAHPKDGWSFGSMNGRWDINQARSLEERRRDCTTWQQSFRGTTRYLCDGMDNKAKLSYMSAPDRLYIVDVNGVVRYQGDSGPFGYSAAHMEQTLTRLLQ